MKNICKISANIFKTCAKYVQNMCKICAKYVQNMCKMSAKYLQNICKISEKYLQNICKICAKYLKNICKDMCKHCKIPVRATRGRENFPCLFSCQKNEQRFKNFFLILISRLFHFKPTFKGSYRLCKIVDLSMQCCGKLLSDSFETY